MWCSKSIPEVPGTVVLVVGSGWYAKAPGGKLVGPYPEFGGAARALIAAAVVGA